MSQASDMSEHFANVAKHYRQVRTTDEAPILYIRDRLAGCGPLRGADVGCGAGRYDRLLFRHLPDLHLTCVDGSRQMLAQLSAYLGDHGIHDFDTVHASDEGMDLGEGRFDFICTFNAIHHFDLPTFLAKAARALKVGGRLFIYTRTPEQNAASIWGRFFPRFTEMEDRLLELSQMESSITASTDLRLSATKRFRYQRRSSLERLIEQVRNLHYSTFSLYRESDLARAIPEFAASVRRQFDDPASVAWADENLMVEVARTEG